MRVRSIAVLFVFATSGALAADIYKCPTATGKVEFRDTPCPGVVGEKVKVQTNGTRSDGADPMAAIRAEDAEFRARRAARLKAEASADEELYRQQERAYHQERAHRANEDLAQAIREGNNQRAADYYNSTLVRPPYYRPYSSSPSPPAQYGAAPTKK